MSAAFIRLQHLTPQHALSRLVGRFADSAVPGVKNTLIKRFIDAYDVDMSEAAEPAGAYPTFNAFFTRALKPGVRPLGDEAQFVLSPADGSWLFWVTVNLDTKETKFADTLDEHNAQVAELNAWLADHATPSATP